MSYVVRCPWNWPQKRKQLRPWSRSGRERRREHRFAHFIYLIPKHLCVLQVEDDDIDIYMKEKKDEEEELREAMEAGKESTVFARVKVPTQVS